MKIGYLLQEGVPDLQASPPGGAANHVIYVIQELQKAGHQVCVLAKFGQRIWRSDDLVTFSPVCIRRMDTGPFRWAEKAVRRLQSKFKLAYANYFESLRFSLACQQELSDCDVYFERMGWLGYGGGLAAEKLNIPLVLEVNGDHLDEFKSLGITMSRSQYWLAAFIMRKAARRVRHVIATGEGWKQKYIQRWGVNPAQVSVVENGSAIADILDRSDLRSFSNEAKNKGQIHLVYSGGFEPWHGITVLIKAVSKAINQGCNLHVTLVGSGSEQEIIKSLIYEFGLEMYFTLTEQVSIETLAQILARADIGISPYCGRVEFSGLKLLDYKAAGLATIASGKNKQPEVIIHGHTGWIVPPCDEDTLSDVIVHLSENPKIIRMMGQQARLEAEQLHRWRNTAREIENLFKSILAESNQFGQIH